MIDTLATQSAQSAVPQGYAEKAMASLMQLHTELMDEKERRVELYRRLMEKEQSLAEMKSYVKALEEKLASLSPPPRAETHPGPAQATPPPPRQVLRAAPPPAPSPRADRHPPVLRPAAAQAPAPMPRTAPPPLRQAMAVGVGRAAAARGVPDGWKTW